MKIAIASDHAGFNYKKRIMEWLQENGHQVIDFGAFSEESSDYPDYAFPAAESVSKNIAEFGVVICGSGIGVSITANKVAGARAANCCTPEMAKLARQHNNANIVAFGERLVDFDTAVKIVSEFISAEFEGGRHNKRVEKIHALTGK